jgi:imidazolonepropionase-like amidohydrolase
VSAPRRALAAALPGALLLAWAWAAGAAPVAVVGGTIHPVDGPAIENGVLLFDDDTGNITAVGAAGDVAIPDSAARIDATEHNVWPGLINVVTYLGLAEIDEVRATLDMDEHGTMNPNARAEIALNASSAHIPVTRANGVLLAAILPRGGLVSGTAAAIALDGWTSEEMVRRAPVGLVVNWPAMPADASADSAGAGWQAEVARLDDMILQARAYQDARESQTVRDADVRWESLHGVVSGEVPVWIQASTLRQIHAALDWTKKHGLRMVLLDGSGSVSGDSPLCGPELASRGIPVIVRTDRLPDKRSDPYDDPYTLPARLYAAGVSLAFGTWDSANARNLPQEASRAVAYGLPREAAERALTLGAAEVLGIDDRYGSLVPGRSATFLIVDGDVLEVRMHVERAWIDGHEISLESRHTRLWKKWSARPLPQSAESSNE